MKFSKQALLKMCPASVLSETVFAELKKEHFHKIVRYLCSLMQYVNTTRGPVLVMHGVHSDAPALANKIPWEHEAIQRRQNSATEIQSIFRGYRLRCQLLQESLLYSRIIAVTEVSVFPALPIKHSLLRRRSNDTSVDFSVVNESKNSFHDDSRLAVYGRNDFVVYSYCIVC